MKKIRLTRIMTIEYEPKQEYYPEGFTIEDMAKLDAEAEDREAVFFELDQDKVQYEVIEYNVEYPEGVCLLRNIVD